MRILLPTDFSENAWHAIRYAIYLFENIRCTFFLLHAHQVSPSALISTINKERDTRLHDITHDESQTKLHRLLAQLEKTNKVKLHQYEAILESDALLQAVGRWVIDKDVDYICMGTQGASGLKEIFMGSNTVNIIKNINFCPVIAVPSSYQFSQPRTIAFATDYKHLYQKVELKPLLEIVKLWEATLRIIHMQEDDVLNEDQQYLQNLLSGLLNAISYTIEEIKYHPTTAYRINEWAEKHAVNILAILNSSHSFVSGLLREPVVKKIAFKTNLPLLVLPEAV